MNVGTYSASREIRLACEIITDEYPLTFVWSDGEDSFDLDDTVRLMVEDEAGAIALYVFDEYGGLTANATFTNMPAAVIASVANSYLT